MDVSGLDHLVVTVTNIERAVHFYGTVLGGNPETFDDGRRAVSFGDQKINFHLAGDEYTPHAVEPAVGSGDFCLIVDDSVDDLRRELREHGVAIVHGPVEKVGARGRMESVYIRDPDGNLVELARYDTEE